MIYEISCKNYEQIYIGLIIIYLKRKLIGNNYNKNKLTALKLHINTTNHNFLFDD